MYLSDNLPPDDASMEMNSRGLLTVKKREYLQVLEQRSGSEIERLILDVRLQEVGVNPIKRVRKYSR